MNRGARLSRLVARALAVGICAPLAGCMVGPDYVPPPAPPVTGYTREPLRDSRFSPGADVGGRWWTAFGSKDLDALVEEALAHNPNLEAAQASLDMARENVLAQEGTLFPTVTADDKTSYQKAPGGGLQSPLQNQQRFTYALFTPRLSVAYAPDVFGGARRQVESVAARAEDQRFQLEAAYLTLSTNVVAAAIQEAALREQLAATQKVIQSQEKIRDLLKRP